MWSIYVHLVLYKNFPKKTKKIVLIFNKLTGSSDEGGGGGVYKNIPTPMLNVKVTITEHKSTTVYVSPTLK